MPWDWRHCVHVRPHAVECDSLTCPRELRVDLPKKSTLLERTNGDEPRYVHVCIILSFQNLRPRAHDPTEIA